MCGIFGVIAGSETSYAAEQLQKLFRSLMKNSETRGSDASGMITVSTSSIDVLKVSARGDVLLSSAKGGELVRNAFRTLPWACIGHTRMRTNGVAEKNEENQPVIAGRTVGVHNGIIVNDELIWKKHAEWTRKHEVDTEALLALLDGYRSEDHGLQDVVGRVFREISGSASIAVAMADRDEILLATNTGSLYVSCLPDAHTLIFASESRILHHVLDQAGIAAMVQQLPAGSAACIAFSDPAYTPLQYESPEGGGQIIARTHERLLNDLSVYPQVGPRLRPPSCGDAAVRVFEKAQKRVDALRRCTRCILPETMPHVQFDKEGVCNYCHSYTPMRSAGVDALREGLEREIHGERSRETGADLLMGFSGGRDSSYGLHVMKKELGFQPIALTYDWGMITDLGRRNQARMCSKLGIEQVLVSADIRKKRDFIRKNILAWIRKPELGTVPLFMAGDKRYFKELLQLSRDTGISSMIMSENPLERTHFKYGFVGVTYRRSDVSPYADFGFHEKSQIFSYYAKEFLRNPAYLNASMLDSFDGYHSFYIVKHAYKYLFDYIRWDEKTIEQTLINEYDWETAPDTGSTWRIGDGTAPFYNFIYYVLAGLTENDTFRSNQIREGMLTREEALARSRKENHPRIPSLEWYFDTVGVDMAPVIDAIACARKLYDP